MTPEEYLKRPYHYVLVYDNESQTWTGKIKEFPGCVCQEEIGLECFEGLYYTALDWIAAALDLGQEIPEPEGGGGVMYDHQLGHLIALEEAKCTKES